MNLVPTTRVRAAANQLSTEVGEDAMVLDLDQGVYFGIEGAGQLIWRLVQQPIFVDDVVTAVVAEYDVDPARATDEVVGFLDELRENHLLDVVEATPESAD